MAKIFITGSSDGLGLRTAKSLTSQGHTVYLHARNAQRAKDATTACPTATACLIADLSSTVETKTLANELNKLGPWDAIIHNAGLYRSDPTQKGKEGIPSLFAVNTLAPYLLTCLVHPPPKRMIYVSSQLHGSGDPSLTNIQSSNYGDSKLHNILLANFFARSKAFKSNGTLSNSLDPGWVPTKMGGFSAPDNIDKAIDTYVMLALGEGASKGMSGMHWYQCKERGCLEPAKNPAVQDKLIGLLEGTSGVKVPE